MEQTLEIIVPDTWADVTLNQYMAFMKSLKPYEGSELYGQVMLEKAAAHFCNVPLLQVTCKTYLTLVKIFLL